VKILNVIMAYPISFVISGIVANLKISEPAPIIESRQQPTTFDEISITNIIIIIDNKMKRFRVN